MSNNRYVKMGDHLGRAEIDLVNGDVRAVLIDTNEYSPDFSSDEYLSDIPEDAIVGTLDESLSGKTLSNGVFDADDALFGAISSSYIGAVVLYMHTGNPATSVLLAYIDESPLFPLDSGGWDVEVAWSNSANKIFRL